MLLLISLCTAVLPVNFSRGGSIKEHLISSYLLPNIIGLYGTGAQSARIIHFEKLNSSVSFQKSLPQEFIASSLT